MTRDQLIEAVVGADMDDLIDAICTRLPSADFEIALLEALNGSIALEELISQQVAEAEASFEEGREAAMTEINETLMEMLAEGRIEDAGHYLERQGSNRPWYVFKAGALMQGRLSL